MGKWNGPEGSRSVGGKKGTVIAPPLLKAMRRVLKQDESEDRTEGERQCRRQLRQNADEFMRVLHEQEKEHSQRKAKLEAARARAEPRQRPEGRSPQQPRASASLPADPGTARVVELIDRLLREYESSAGTAAAPG